MDFQSILSQIDATHVGMVFQLVLLEGLLSFDNALALAALVTARLKHPLDRKRALLWGIWGAYFTRVGIIFVGVWLMQHEWVKALAGGYLVWLAINELFLKKTEEHAVEKATEADRVLAAANLPRDTWKSVWKTIVAVEVMDLMFSIDSIAVALAVSKETWVLVAGAVLGILMMRIAASYFIKLIDKFPLLVPTAFILVGLAGVKVLLEIKHLEFGSTIIPMLGLHIPEYVFLPIMVAILGGSMVLNAKFPERFRKH